MEYFYSWGLLFVLPFTIYAYLRSNKDEKIKMIISGIGFGILSISLRMMSLQVIGNQNI